MSDDLDQYGPVQWPRNASDAIRVYQDAYQMAVRIRDTYGDETIGPAGGFFHKRADRVDYVNLLQESRVYFWERDQAELVSSSARSYPLRAEAVRSLEAPGDEPPSWFPRGMPWAFCVFRSPILGATYNGVWRPFTALLWAIGVGGRDHEIRLAIAGFEWRPRVTVPIWWSDTSDQFGHSDRALIQHSTLSEYQAEREEFIKWICTASTFVEQRIMAHDEVKPSRRLAKQSSGRAAPLPVCRVVRLRRVATGDREQHEMTTGQHEHAYRWWVRGHWRNQWFPSRKMHAPMWIAPHLKGPDDKPVRPIVPTVHHVAQ